MFYILNTQEQIKSLLTLENTVILGIGEKSPNKKFVVILEVREICQLPQIKNATKNFHQKKRTKN